MVSSDAALQYFLAFFFSDQGEITSLRRKTMNNQYGGLAPGLEQGTMLAT
jgi:hypothetical protein